MQDKIIELIALLDYKTDSKIIDVLYEKIVELNCESEKLKDFSYKYSIQKIASRDMSTLMMGVEKTIRFSYNSEEFEIAKILENDIRHRYCYVCDGIDSCDLCPFKKRIQYINKLINKHNKIQSDILKNLSSEFILNKYLVNKIIVKLNNLKN